MVRLTMKNHSFIEAFIGGFTLIFVFCLLFFFTNKYFSYSPSNYKNYFNYLAKFNDIDGLFVGSLVKVGGVVVGKINDIELDKESYRVIVKFSILSEYKLPDDSIVSVGTSGLIGEKYLKLLIGNSNNFLNNEGEIEFTQSSISLENLIGLLKK